jgi:hypothetical protein
MMQVIGRSAVLGGTKRKVKVSLLLGVVVNGSSREF